MTHKDPLFTNSSEPAPSRAMRRHKKKKGGASLKSAFGSKTGRSPTDNTARRGHDSSSRYRGVRR